MTNTCLFISSCLFQSKLADSSDWPTLGSEAATISNKKEISNATSNSDLREKDKKPPTSAKPKAEGSDSSGTIREPKEAREVEPVFNHVAATEATSPTSDAAANDKEANKIVPKVLDDGAKRVNAKPKWNRFEVEPKSSSASSTQNRRKTDRDDPPPDRRNNRDDYYSRRDDRNRDDDRSTRRGNSNRGSVPSSSSRHPRSGAAAPAPPSTSSSVKSTSREPRDPRGPRRDPFIMRSNRPSYTESKTPGLNGNPITPMKSSDPYDAKKQKPLIGRPILIDPMAPLVTAHNIYGTYYFNGPTPYALDTIGNIKESIKKQM